MTQKRAKSLEQIEKELEALKKQKRNALRKKNREEIETLGKIAKEAKLTPNELSNLIRLFNLIEDNEHDLITTYNLLNKHFQSLSEKRQQRNY